MSEVPVDPIDPGDTDSGDEEGPKGSERAVLADLARERDRRQAAEAEIKRLRKAEQELARLQEANTTEAEKAIAAARAEGRTEALSVANKRIITAEVKATAAGVLQDPDDAIRLLDLDTFEVDDDGNVDTKAIKAEIAALAKAKPYLAVGAKPAPLPAGGVTPSTGPSMDDVIRAAVRGRRS